MALALRARVLLWVMLTMILTLGVGCSTDEGWQLQPFQKYDGNPIITPRGTTWEAKDVFNPTTLVEGDTVKLLYRAEDSTGIGDWNGTSRIGLATSTDGIHFDRAPEPVFEPTEPWELPGGTEDPRVVKMEGTYYLTYTAYDGETARLALATSPDLRRWTKHGLVFPDSGWTKSGAILPEPIDGRYWMYFGDTNIWAAHSSDGIQWTPISEPVVRPRDGHFDSRLVEPGPAPLLTDDGILLIYNGADQNLVYGVGQVLLDPDDPTQVLERAETPFLTPTTELEREGQISNVVFAEGLARLGDTWFLYYGMGDSGIGVAMHHTADGE